MSSSRSPYKKAVLMSIYFNMQSRVATMASNSRIDSKRTTAKMSFAYAWPEINSFDVTSHSAGLPVLPGLQKIGKILSITSFF